MKTSVILLLSLLASTGCNYKTSIKPATPGSSGGEHEYAATYTSEPSRIYRIVDGMATVVDREPTDLEQLGRVKIIGAVQRPGLYCFSRSVLLEDVVQAARPFLGSPRYSHTCGSAALTQIRISSPVGPGDDKFETIQLDFVRYMQRDEQSSRAERILLKGGVVFIPEWF